MESLTYLKNIKISPKKMRFMLDLVKKMSPNESLDYLKYSPKKEASVYYKAIHSAIHNAVNTLKVEPGVLQFKLFTIEEGRALKRFKPGSRGGVKPIKRRYSHIKILLGSATEQAAKTEVAKTEVAKSEVKKSKVVEKKTEKKEVKAKAVRKPAAAKGKEAVEDTK